MTWSLIVALIGTVGTVWGLLKRKESRLVLLAGGFFMAFVSLEPFMAFQQFDKSMTNGSLIIAICSAMGFAGVVSLTKCDLHLVALLTKPLKRLGIFLLPACMLVTCIIAVAIPSTSGVCAAIGPTVVPILIRAGFKPAMAAAAVISSILPALFNPGVAHNVFVAKLAGMDVMTLIGLFKWHIAGLSLGSIVLLTLLAVLLGDYRPNQEKHDGKESPQGASLPERPNLFFAIAPLVPVAILMGVSMWAPSLKMSVATAMLIGTVYALAVTRSSPTEVTKKFFNGMGSGYGSILGIIIAAGVFAAGLRACGVIDLFVGYLTNVNEAARLGAAVGPFVLGILTGSGDAAAFAFNEAISPHAPQFGMTVENLGYLATISGNFGRMASPLAGGMIIVAGIAGVEPMEIVKRTAPIMVILLVSAYFLLG